MLKRVVVALSAIALSTSVSAQGTFDSFGLGDIDPWGIGTLSRAEGALSNTIWQNSDADVLSDLLTRTRVHSMTPAMRELVRRAVLSSAVRPQDDDGTLLLKRYDVIKDLGNPQVYADFIRQSSGVEGIVSQFELTVDNEFAQGDLRSACSLVRASEQQTAYLLRARAVCYALEADYSSALVALEFARDAGFEDVWYVQVINAMSSGAAKLPQARYHSGLTLALSIDAGLISETDGLIGLHPALAVQVVNRSDISRKLRIQAADVAFTADVMDVRDLLRAYAPDPVEDIPDPIDDGSPDPDTDETNTVPIAAVNPLDAALSMRRTDESTDLEEAMAMHRALQLSAYDIARFRAVARALQVPLRKLNNQSVFQQYGETFALAALAIGDDGLAARFSSGMMTEGGPTYDPFIIAWLDGIRIISGKDRSPQSALEISRRLAETASEPEKAAAIRMMRAFSALGLPLSVDARRFVSAVGDETIGMGRTISDRDLALIQAAFQSGATAEAILRAAIQIGYNPAELNMTDLELVVRMLRSNNLDSAARQLLLEGINYHRPTN